MRLSSVLSEYYKNQPQQIEAIIDNDKYTNIKDDATEDIKLISSGDYIEINIGTIILSFFCTTCNDILSFKSVGKTHCLIINNKLISIDCSFECIDKTSCKKCKETIQSWFLIEADDIFSSSPKVRVLKTNFKIPEHVKFLYEKEDQYSEWIAKADFAFKERLGVGSVIYLRTIFEKLTKEIGIKEKAAIYNDKGKLKPFEQILSAVDKECSIIPALYKENGYELFRKLSEIAHGNTDEQTALDNYAALKRLVLGIMDNIKNKKEEIKNNKEIAAALCAVGFNNGGQR